jgi:hypothetical protein
VESARARPCIWGGEDALGNIPDWEREPPSGRFAITWYMRIGDGRGVLGIERYEPHPCQAVFGIGDAHVRIPYEPFDRGPNGSSTRGRQPCPWRVLPGAHRRGRARAVQRGVASRGHGGVSLSGAPRRERHFLHGRRSDPRAPRPQMDLWTRRTKENIRAGFDPVNVAGGTSCIGSRRAPQQRRLRASAKDDCGRCHWSVPHRERPLQVSGDPSGRRVGDADLDRQEREARGAALSAWSDRACVRRSRHAAYACDAVGATAWRKPTKRCGRQVSVGRRKAIAPRRRSSFTRGRPCRLAATSSRRGGFLISVTHLGREHRARSPSAGRNQTFGEMALVAADATPPQPPCRRSNVPETLWERPSTVNDRLQRPPRPTTRP